MQRLLITAVMVGVISGLLVGGFHNLFTVPVIERAIALEEKTAPATPPEPAPAPLVSLGEQRVGLAVGNGIIGAVLGLIFAAGYSMLRRAVPHWPPLALAVVAGALGFWALSLFPFIKYPLNPPGVGDPATLVYRQAFQSLFMFLSACGVAGLLFGARWVNTSTAQGSQRLGLYGAGLAAYGIFAAVIAFAIPGNPDPVPVPVDLLELFRTLTMVGQFLLWALLAAGVALALMWSSRPGRANVGRRAASAGQGPEARPT